MNSTDKNKLFARFLAGISKSDEEKEMLQTPEVKQLMQEQWDEGKPSSEEFPQPDLHMLLVKIYRRIVGKQFDIKKEKQRRLPVYQRFAAAAAVVILLLSVGTILWNEGVIPGKYMVTITAPSGVRSEVFLPDGSRVWLNSGSKLTYNKKFDSHVRKLKLSGEAYFNISHNPSRPLIVETKTANIEVLGTRFNVVSIPSQDKWEATLVLGNIRVSPSKKGAAKPFALSPGQRALWNKNTNDFTVEATNTSMATRWVSNQLMFENESFGMLANQLESTFGVKIEIPSSLANSYRFTATFTDESIFEIFNLLKITAPFDFAIQGNKVIVSAKVETEKLN
jgi:ferric-dicitrate binding protein FerR (iron transport regulator)